MKTLSLCALFAVLAAGAGQNALAQRASTTKPLIQCTAGQADTRASQPCSSRHEKAVRYALGLTREEFDCTLSGNCVPTGYAGRV